MYDRYQSPVYFFAGYEVSDLEKAVDCVGRGGTGIGTADYAGTD